jgi:hypothetical protein
MRPGLQYGTLGNGPKSVSITGKCIFCGKHQVVKMSAQEYGAFNFSDALIQNALPNHSADDIEFLISGICPKCFPSDETP